MMRDLKTILDGADRIPAPDLWPDIERRPHRRVPAGPGLGRRVAVAGLALVVAAAGLVVAGQAFLGRSTRSGQRGTDPGPPGLNARVTAEIPMGRFPSEIAVGEGAVWVTVNAADPPERWFVARIDPTTNSVTDEVEINEAIDVAVGGGAVWVLGRDPGIGPAVFRIDPARREVAETIPLDCGRCFPTQIVATDGAVWLTVSTDYPDSGEVLRVDPATNEVSGRLSLPGDPRDLVVGEGALWVYSLTHFAGGGVSGGTIYRVDPETVQVAATLLAGEVPPASGVNTPPVLAEGHGFVWTSRHRGGRFTFGSSRIDIVRIDSQTNEVVGDPIPLDTLFLPFSTEAGSVWFRGGYEDARPSVSRLDPETLRVEEVIRHDEVVLDGAVDPVGEVMWLSNYSGSVTRIDLR
jgi:hypothetical protein